MLPMIDVDAIEERVQRAQPGRALAFLFTLIPFAIGWLVRRAWMCAVWVWIAILAGWRDAGGENLNDQRDGQGDGQPKGWS